MADRGYEALVFSYEDDGNFKRQVWRYGLIAASSRRVRTPSLR